MCLCLVLPCANCFFYNPFIFHTYIFGGISFLFFINAIINSHKIEISSMALCSIILFVFFCLRNLTLISPYHIRWISCIFIIIAFSSYQISKVEITRIIQIVCSIELIVCMSQLFTCNNRFFCMTGTFENPSGLSVLFAFCTPFIIADLKRQKVINIALILSVLVILILTTERKGLLIISLYIIFHTNSPNVKKIKYILLLVTLLFLFLYSIYAPESTLGRLLILSGSFKICWDNLILGAGAFAFGKEYMLWQADFFSNNPTSLYTIYADNVVHSQNEFLNLIIENGIVIVILIVPFVRNFVRTMQHNMTTWHEAIIIMLLMSNFTYSFYYYITLSLFVICIAQISTETKFIIKLGTVKKIIFSFIAVSFFFFVISGTFFEYTWKKISTNYIESYTFNFEEYDEIKDIERFWNGNPLFYFNLASIHRNLLNFQESNKAIYQYNKYFVDYDSQVMLANNFYDMKDYKNAKKYYTLAHSMCPNRFIPLRGLLRTEIKNANIDNARSIAIQILRKKEKIQSFETKLIKLEASKFLKDEK